MRKLRFKVAKELDLVSKLINGKPFMHTPYLIFFSLVLKNSRISPPSLIPLFLILLQITTILRVSFFPSSASLTFLRPLPPTYFLVPLTPMFPPNLVWLEPCPQLHHSYQTHLHYQWHHHHNSKHLALCYVLGILRDRYCYYPHFRDVDIRSPKSYMATRSLALEPSV